MRVDANMLQERGRTKQTYTEQERMQALAVYGETLSSDTAAFETSIPPSTIRTWVRSEEGIADIAAIRSAVRTQCAHVFAKITYAAATQLLDRIENGDEVIEDGHRTVVDEDGKETLVRCKVYMRRKMPGKDLAHCMSIAADKHALVSGTSGELTPANAQLLSIVDKLLQMGAERGVIATPSAKQPDQNTTGSGQVPENTGLDQ